MTELNIAIKAVIDAYDAPQPSMYTRNEHEYMIAHADKLEKAIDALRAAMGSAEPVAVVGDVFTLHWIGSGPIAPLIECHGIKVGTKLYTAPPAPVSAEPVHFFRQHVGGNWIEATGGNDPRDYLNHQIFEFRTLFSASPSTDAKDSEHG